MVVDVGGVAGGIDGDDVAVLVRRSGGRTGNDWRVVDADHGKANAGGSGVDTVADAVGHRVNLAFAFGQLLEHGIARVDGEALGQRVIADARRQDRRHIDHRQHCTDVDIGGAGNCADRHRSGVLGHRRGGLHDDHRGVIDPGNGEGRAVFNGNMAVTDAVVPGHRRRLSGGEVLVGGMAGIEAGQGNPGGRHAQCGNRHAVENVGVADVGKRIDRQHAAFVDRVGERSGHHGKVIGAGDADQRAGRDDDCAVADTEMYRQVGNLAFGQALEIGVGRVDREEVIQRVVSNAGRQRRQRVGAADQFGAGRRGWRRRRVAAVIAIAVLDRRRRDDHGRQRNFDNGQDGAIVHIRHVGEQVQSQHSVAFDGGGKRSTGNDRRVIDADDGEHGGVRRRAHCVGNVVSDADCCRLSGGETLVGGVFRVDRQRADRRRQETAGHGAEGDAGRQHGGQAGDAEDVAQTRRCRAGQQRGHAEPADGAVFGHRQFGRAIDHRRRDRATRRRRRNLRQRRNVDRQVGKLDEFDSGQLVLAIASRAGGQNIEDFDRTVGVGDDLVIGGQAGVLGDIAAEAAVEIVVAGIAAEVVVAIIAIHHVIATAADTGVVTAAAMNAFANVAAVQAVIQFGAIYVERYAINRHVGTEHVGNDQAGIENMVTGIGNADLQRVEALMHRRVNGQRRADAVVFDRQVAVGVVDEVAVAQVGTDDAQRRLGVAVEIGDVDAVDQHDADIDKLVDPFRILVAAEDKIEADRGDARIGNGEIEAQRRRIVGHGLEHAVDHGIEIGVTDHVVADAVGSAGIGDSWHQSGSKQQAGTDAQSGQAAVVITDRSRATDDVQRGVVNRDARCWREQSVGDGLRTGGNVGRGDCGKGGHGVIPDKSCKGWYEVLGRQR